ncbi:N-acetylglucosaminyltransferase subunit [Mucor ambiguus]|uniref:N-acetylglucosaminyltransferase subunit n=1 Tax=Mucor ambiguus TaxID=91626 RepID=A0A0C9MGW3_9FUNG|nr:N-acetylglucosaminyltransferase subunit [Mucor ambiguus]
MLPSGEGVKLFWPSHLCSPKTKHGFLIGWYNTTGTVCIASVVSGVELKELQELLQEFCVSGEHSEFTHINKVCNVPPRIVGVLVHEQEDDRDYSVADQVWIKVGMSEAYIPVLLSLESNNKTLDWEKNQVIFYEQPNPKRLQFLALNPLELDISSTEMNIPSKPYFGHLLNGELTPVSDDLDIVLVQINSSYFLEHGIQLLSLHHKQKNAARYPTLDRVIRFMRTAANDLVRIIFTSPKGFIGYHIKQVVMNASLCLLFLVLVLAEVTLHLLSVRLPKFILNGVAFKDLFAAGQQVDLRLQQLFFWPRQYMMLRKQNWANTAKTRAYYISFYNSMWLVANDIIIGLAIGSFLVANNEAMANKLHRILHEYTVESLQSMMLWFLESPAGLKLNHELGSFLSELFLWLIRLWTLCTQTIEPFTPQIIHLIGMSGVFGVTMIISLSSDFLAFMTLHVYCFYMVAARIFNWQLVILSSLFNLFRGKKRNILRNRIDSCDYDLDQLLLGTSLFTLLTFLFPTILIYYLTFALGRVGVIFLQAIMETILAFFNHFPLFAIMLRIKDPHRLPGGLQFEIFQNDEFLLEHHGILHRLTQAWSKFKSQKAVSNSSNISSGSSSSSKKFKRKKQRSVSFAIPGATGTTSNTSYHPSSTTTAAHQDKKSKPLGKRGAYLWMRNMPIPLGAIFFQYMLLWKRLSAHYFSAYVFNCLLYGEPIKPIPKLQYPMLPDQRPSLSALWQTLKVNLWDLRPKRD